MNLGVDPKVDYAFRKLFGSETNLPLLLDLLDAVLQPPPDQRIVSAEILTPFNEKDTEADKETIVDIKARDQLGRQYNVEMEMSATWTFPQRVLYYWAVLHAGQLTVGDEYVELRPTISICFVNRILFSGVPDYHLDFQLRSSRYADLIFSPHESVHVLELPKFARTLDELTDPLDAWCYFLKHGDDLDPDNLPAPLCKAAIPRAMEVLKMLKQSELEWHRYQSQLKARRDRVADLKDSRDEGRAEGRAEGLEAGDVIGRIHAYQSLLQAPLTPREQLLTLARADLHAKAAALEQEVAARLTK